MEMGWEKVTSLESGLGKPKESEKATEMGWEKGKGRE